MNAVLKCGKVLPYYSSEETTPRVYHVCSECCVGKKILPKNKRSGKDGRKCKVCIDLGG